MGGEGMFQNGWNSDFLLTSLFMVQNRQNSGARTPPRWNKTISDLNLFCVVFTFAGYTFIVMIIIIITFISGGVDFILCNTKSVYT